MDITTESDSVKITITLTSSEAQELMNIFDRTQDPTTLQKMLYSTLGSVANKNTDRYMKTREVLNEDARGS